ncbi:MAG TPA: hypothetical protein VH500_03760 [Nitrososphaeraceae archaeon]
MDADDNGVDADDKLSLTEGKVRTNGPLVLFIDDISEDSGFIDDLFS